MQELREAGYERVTPTMIAEAYELLLGLDEDKIKGIVTDKKHPMSLRIVAKAMLSPKGHEMLETMMNRAHGRPKSETTIHVDKDSFKIGFED